VTLARSTLSGNKATRRGGGIYQSYSLSNFPISISGSILAGNTTGSGGPDVWFGPKSTLNAYYSVIGFNLTGNFNVVTNHPLLGPLADHGGPTQTHALLPGSPALDAGDPAITSGTDQRGAGFNRVVDGDVVSGARIDIGSYESQGVPGFPAGDYNHNGIADAADYVVWRKTLGQTGPNLPANGDNTGASQDKIDQADYVFWRTNFGNTAVPVSGAGAGLDLNPAAGAGDSLAAGSVLSAPADAGAAQASLARDTSPTSIHFDFVWADDDEQLMSPNQQHNLLAPKLSATTTASANQLLLAIEQALNERDHVADPLQWAHDLEEQDVHSISDDLLTSSLNL
jgi:hypothetical protein